MVCPSLGFKTRDPLSGATSCVVFVFCLFGGGISKLCSWHICSTSASVEGTPGHIKAISANSFARWSWRSSIRTCKYLGHRSNKPSSSRASSKPLDKDLHSCNSRWYLELFLWAAVAECDGMAGFGVRYERKQITQT